MRKLIILILPLLVLTSCQITEEVYFNKNGSGTYNMKIDMGTMTKIVKGMAKNDSINKDSIRKKRVPEKIDTVFFFADILKEKRDSINDLTEEERKLVESLKDVRIRMHIDEANDEMLISYEIPFNNIEDLSDINKKFNKVNSYNNKGSKDVDKMIPEYKVSYKFNKHYFHRKIKMLKKAENQEVNEEKEFFQMMQYEIVYHFPYEIDEVSYKEARIGADGKSVYIKVPMDNLFKNKDLMDLKIKFK